MKKIVLKMSSDFNCEETFFCGQAFRFQKKDTFYSCVINRSYCEFHQKGNELHISSVLNEDFFNNYFALDVDYEALKKIMSADEKLQKCVELGKGIRVLRQDFFETLISFIISQNNNITRIGGIIERLCTMFGEPVGNSFAFPTAKKLQSLSLQELAPIRCGFRDKYILSAAELVASGLVDEVQLRRQITLDARKTLMTIKGVGPKVADCVMLFGLGKFEAFPRDVHINRAMEQLFVDGLPPEILPFAGIAQQYIFGYARHNLH